MLWRRVPGWVAEETFQEAGRMRRDEGWEIRGHRASVSLESRTVVILPRVQEDVCCLTFRSCAEGG